ncbi:MAG: hypothetical protein RR555_03155 [Bacteroidales bacterium]
MDRASILRRDLGCTNFLIILPAVLLFVACHGRDKPLGGGDADYFLKQNNPGLYVNGNNLFEYTDKDCQWAFNKIRGVARLQKDDQSYYVNMIFSSWPNQIKEDVNVEIDYKTSTQQRKTLFVMILLKSENGKNWLWNDESKTGVILEQ